MTQEPAEYANFGHAQPLAEATTSDSVNTANEETNQVTVAPVPSQAGADTPSSDLDQESSSASPSKICACITCLGIGTFDPSGRGPYPCHHPGCHYVRTKFDEFGRHAHDGNFHPMKFAAPCRHAGCNVVGNSFTWEFACANRNIHEKTHYLSIPGDNKSSYACLIQNCRFSSKRWSDLHRHTTAKHCNNPAKFACSVIGCKYNGEGNGFTRKDKLKDHCKSMHQGQKIHGQAVRAIKPAPASSHAGASGSSSINA